VLKLQSYLVLVCTV